MKTAVETMHLTNPKSRRPLKAGLVIAVPGACLSGCPGLCSFTRFPLESSRALSIC